MVINRLEVRMESGQRLVLRFALLALLAGVPDAYADSAKGPDLRTTGKGLFTVTMAVERKELAVGINSLDLAVRDKRKDPVTGATVSVTPWMPEHGHGVWEKPRVTERGGGRYRVENVVLVMSGRWDLKVTIRNGAEEDEATFTYEVAPGGPDPSEGRDPERDPGEPGRETDRTAGAARFRQARDRGFRVGLTKGARPGIVARSEWSIY